MTTLYLVRHGKAAAGWTEDPDPGLSDLGRAQAGELAKTLAEYETNLILSSPLKRCRQTARPLAAACGLPPLIEPAVGEVPSPVADISARGDWLRAIMAGTWDGADAATNAWRAGVLCTLCAQRQDAVIFTHFVAINAAVGAATDDARVLCFRPNYCSVTELTVDNGVLALIKRGREAVTKIG